MTFRQIATIKLELETIDSKDKKKESNSESCSWNNYGNSYAKDGDLTKYTLQKIGEKVFFIKIELFDFFNMDSGKWNENDFPEWGNIINSMLSGLEKEFNCKIKIIEIDRNVI
jgi:hypothetical protein